MINNFLRLAIPDTKYFLSLLSFLPTLLRALPPPLTHSLYPLSWVPSIHLSHPSLPFSLPTSLSQPLLPCFCHSLLYSTAFPCIFVSPASLISFVVTIALGVWEVVFIVECRAWRWHSHGGVAEVCDWWSPTLLALCCPTIASSLLIFPRERLSM